MALQVKLTSGPTQQLEIRFYGDESWVLQYTPQTPDITTVDFTPEALRDGGERLYSSRRNVTETMTVSIGGSSTAALRENINKIESWFRQAEEYQSRGIGYPVYVNVTPDNISETNRSEILDGKLMLGDNALSYEWRHRRVTATLAWTRRYYWEGEQVSLPLVGAIAASPTRVRTGSGQNWLSIPASSVKGSIPCVPAITITNETNTTLSLLRTSNIYLSTGIAPGGSAVLNFEAESAGSKLTGSTLSGSGHYSGSAAYKQTYSSSAGWQTLYRWWIEPANATWLGGDYYRALLRIYAASSASTRFRLRSTLYYGSNEYDSWTSPEAIVAASTHNLIDLGAVQLPPWARKSGYTGPMYLSLEAKRSADATVIVDQLSLMPLVSWKTYNINTFYLPQNYHLVDDGLGHVAMTDELGGAGWGVYTDIGDIYIWPDTEQRIFFYFEEEPLYWPQYQYSISTQPNANHLLSASVFYRPRRLSI